MYQRIMEEIKGKLDDTEYAKEEFGETRNKKYPDILKSRYNKRSELTTFFEYPQEIKKIIYTANAIEGYLRISRSKRRSLLCFALLMLL